MTQSPSGHILGLNRAVAVEWKRGPVGIAELLIRAPGGAGLGPVVVL